MSYEDAYLDDDDYLGDDAYLDDDPVKPWWRFWPVSAPMYKAEVWPEGEVYELFYKRSSKVVPTGRWRIETSGKGATTYLSLEVVWEGCSFWAGDSSLHIEKAIKTYINDCRGKWYDIS